MTTKTSVLSQQFTDPKETKKSTPLKLSEYIRNPFFIATKGVELLFEKAKGIAIFLLVFSILGGIGSIPRPTAQTTSTGSELTPDEQRFLDMLAGFTFEQWLMIATGIFLVFLLITFVSIILRGISDYAAAEIANGRENVTLKESWHAVLRNFWPYTWVFAVMSFRVFLWSLLFLVPGLIMAFRYSLAGVVFFAEKDKKATPVLTRTLALTKDTVMTIFASKVLFNMITLGFLSGIVEAGTSSVLYTQLRDLRGRGEPIPPAHWLSITTVVFYIVLMMALVTFLIVLVKMSLPAEQLTLPVQNGIVHGRF
jgi:hypothetical protein